MLILYTLGFSGIQIYLILIIKQLRIIKNQTEMSKQNPLIYITPRLAILSADLTNKQKQLQIQFALKSRHKNYFHLFNLSSYIFDKSTLSTIGVTNFKWRQIPFSLTQAIKIIASVQNYQTKNFANTAVLVVADRDCYQFCVYICQLYLSILDIKTQNKCKNQNAISEFLKIYKTIDIKNPPVKIIDSFYFKNPQTTFIPVLKVYSETRHNNFQEIYTHYPQNQLTKYYIERKSPLSQSIGMKYCQKKPQTKHFTKPVLVCGDVKIQVFSFDKLNLNKQFICGFNTKAIQYEQSLIQLQINDLYSVQNAQKLGLDQKIMIQISDYCQKCKDQAVCSECTKIVKKLGSTYSQTQIQLQKINRKRTKQECMKICG